MTENKVLVACIVFDEHEPFLDSFLRALDSQDFKEKELVFVDCVGKPEARKKLERSGTVLDSVMRVRTNEAMHDCREKIMDSFADSDCTHLLFLDPDIILSEKAISRLLFHGKEIVSGTYLFNTKIGDKYEICPCLYGFAGDDSVRVMALKEVLENRLVEISCAGLGCTLVTRKVLEELGSSAFEKGSLSDSISFFLNARDAGFEAFADTSVKCNRLVRPEGDSMNDFFSFDSYPNIRNPKVLVGCVTHDKDEPYLKGFLEAVRSQDYTNYDILFADTSGNKDFIAKLRGTGAIVLECFREQDHKIKKITDGRNSIKEYALKNNYDNLMFVDTDTLPPPDALSGLLANRKDLISGVCLSWMNINGTNRVMPNIYDFDEEEGYCQPMFLNNILNKRGTIEISCAGLACALATRRVLEKVSMRFYEKSMAGEDIAFFVDARESGFRTFADMDVRCRHLVFPPGDPRNRKFMFETYEKGQSYTFQVDNITKE